ncbi:MAG: hypothetical protein VX641_06945 [Planctomycetota bacterium]|nr:hypothetical protein [Planctomycetota bacterium]
MHRRTVATLFAFMSTLGSASLAHAGLDLTFANLTESATNTWSVDVQVDWNDVETPIAGFQMDHHSSVGLAVVDTEPLTPGSGFDVVWTSEMILGTSFFGATVIEPEPYPTSLFRLELQTVGEPSELILEHIIFADVTGTVIQMNQDSYSLTIPAPAGLALLAGAFVGVRRRRAG